MARRDSFIYALLLAAAWPARENALAYMAAAADPPPPFTTTALLDVMMRPENRDLFPPEEIKRTQESALGVQAQEQEGESAALSTPEQRAKAREAAKKLSTEAGAAQDRKPEFFSDGQDDALRDLIGTAQSVGAKRQPTPPEVKDGKPVKAPSQRTAPQGGSQAGTVSSSQEDSTEGDGLEVRQQRAREIARAKSSDPRIQRIIEEILVAAYQAYGQGGDSYDRSFIAFLNRQTDPKAGVNGSDLPPMVPAPREEVRDGEGKVVGAVLGWYKPGEDRIGFTQTAFQQGFMGQVTTGIHELLHRYDDQRDNNPIGHNPEREAEAMAYKRMVTILRSFRQASN